MPPRIKCLALIACLTLAPLQLALTQPSAAEGQKSPAGERPAQADRYGDPLPEGAVARLGTLRFRTGSPIHAAALSPDGKVLALSSGSKGIVLLDADQGKELPVPVSQSGTGLPTFSPDGRYLASTDGAGAILLHEATSGKLLRRLSAPAAQFRPCVFSADGKVAAAAASTDPGKGTRVWAFNTATGEKVGEFAAPQNDGVGLALSPDGQTLALWGRGRRLTAGDRQGPDWSRIVQLWDVRAGKERRRLSIEKSDGIVTAAAFSPDGKFLAAAGHLDTIRIWETDQGKERHRLAARLPGGAALTYSPDGKTLLAESSNSEHRTTVRRWDTATGKELGAPEGFKGLVSSVVFRPGGTILVLCIDGPTAHLRDVGKGKLLSLAGGHAQPVVAVGFSPDGRTVTSADLDGQVCQWDVATGQERRDAARLYPRRFGSGLGWTSGCALSADAKYLASAIGPATSLRLWEVASGKTVREWSWKGGGEMGVAFSADGTLLAAGARHAGEAAAQVWETSTGRLRVQLSPAEGQVSALAFSPNGKALATAQEDFRHRHCTVRLWETSTGKEVWKTRLQDSPLYSVAFSPDGKVLAVGSLSPWVYLFDAASGKELGRLQGKDAAFRNTPLAFAPDGKTLAVACFRDGGKDPLIRVWELASGKVRREFRGHRSVVAALAFSPDGALLASGSPDTTVLLWDVGGRLRTSLPARAGPAAPQLEQLWTDLGAAEADVGYQAMRRLMAVPEAAVPLFQKHFRVSGERIEGRQIEKWIAGLDAEKFGEREKAMRALRQAGRATQAALAKALRGNPSAEQRRRLEALLNELEEDDTPTSRLQLVRSMEVLERIGSPAARELLRSLAGGAPEARLTREAKASLERLTRRPTAAP